MKKPLALELFCILWYYIKTVQWAVLLTLPTPLVEGTESYQNGDTTMNKVGVYILTNGVNGKQYVGQSHNLDYRIPKHFSSSNKTCRVLSSAIKKYGKKNFHVQIIEYPGISECALHAVEKWHILSRKSLVPNGYNLQDGGQGGLQSDETKRKIKDANKGRKFTAEHIKNMSKPKRGGKRMPADVRKRMGRNLSENGQWKASLRKNDNLICQRYLEGDSAQELARRFNAGETTIYRILDFYNIPRRSSGETQRIQNRRKQLRLF